MSEENGVKTEWVRAKIDTVIRFYAEAFTAKPGRQIINYDTWLDTAKGEIVFSIITAPKERSPK